MKISHDFSDEIWREQSVGLPGKQINTKNKLSLLRSFARKTVNEERAQASEAVCTYSFQGTISVMTQQFLGTVST